MSEKRPRILVLDDKKEQASVLSHNIKPEFDVRVVHTVEEAERALEEDDFVCAVLDWDINGIKRGHEVWRTAVENEYPIAAILITGFKMNDSEKAQYYKMGISAILSKVEKDDVSGELKSAIIKAITQNESRHLSLKNWIDRLGIWDKPLDQKMNRDTVRECYDLLISREITQSEYDEMVTELTRVCQHEEYSRITGELQ